MPDLSRLNLLARVKRWTARVDARLERLDRELVKLGEEDLARLDGKMTRLEQELEILEDSARELWCRSIQAHPGGARYFTPSKRYYFARRGAHVRLLAVDASSPLTKVLRSAIADELFEGLSIGSITEFEGAILDDEGRRTEWEALPWLLSDGLANPHLFRSVFRSFERYSSLNSGSRTGSRADFYKFAMEQISADAELIDFLAQASALAHEPAAIPYSAVPFGDRDSLPPFTARKQPRHRSVVFLHNNYYHYNVLAEGLRRRGWDAVTVSLYSPENPQAQFMWGEDVNLYDPDPERMRAKVQDFFRSVPERFGAVHFYGGGQPSFFLENCEWSSKSERVPWDFLELRRQGVIIGYTPSGCLDGTLQSSIRKVTGGLCTRCIWELKPEVCGDAVNGAWIEKLNNLIDWIGVETDWMTPEREAMNCVKGPVAMALDPEIWRPDLDIPSTASTGREPGELLVYHAVGNYSTRRTADRDIKGTGAVLAAIERLKAEGMPVRLFFATDIQSREVRFYQVQADIVIDQLNYGRLGANARESLMLGRPLVTNVNRGQPTSSAYMAELPAVHATEETIYEVLKALLNDPERRRALGEAGRKFALKWHSADACAQRFERILDRVRGGLPAESDEIDR